MSEAKQSFVHQAARFSFWAPLTAVAIGFFTSSFGQTERLIIGGINLVLVLAGFVLGVVALFGIRRHGARGILAYSLCGVVLNGLILADRKSVV